MAENPSFAKQYETYPGKTLGNYHLERLFEQLETGPVFLARQTNTPTAQRYYLRFLALPAGLTAEERLLYLGHFQREASQIADLQHPTLLPLSDYGIFEGAPYLVSPDPLSISLQGMVTNSGPIETRLARRYLDGIAAALEHIHQEGILHLNLNPRNVFLSKDGQTLVAESSFVRMLSPQMLRSDPATSQQPLELENGSPLLRDRQGKPLYGLNLASAPAPELLLGQSPDTSSDVYALGALLYYLLTGHRVMRGKTLAEIADQHLNATIPPLRVWRQDLPAELDRLLSSAMAKNPTLRLRHPGALANAYAGLIAPDQSGRKAFVMPAAPPALPVPAAQPHPINTPARLATGTSLSRRQAITLIAAGGGVAAVGAAVWIAGHNGSAAASVASSGSTASVASSQSTTSSTGSSSHSGKVLANTADVPVNSSKTFPIANSANPGVLIHLQNNSFVAFNSTCTHAGCAVNYNRQNHLLECPCHGASFDPARNAAVVGGPAPSPLATIAITVNSDGTITTG